MLLVGISLMLLATWVLSKPPAPMGSKLLYTKSQWKTIGCSFCHLVGEVIRNPEKVRYINETFLTLIQKVEAVYKVKDFRPISLCNVSYKVITKLMAQKFRFVMSSLVSWLIRAKLTLFPSAKAETTSLLLKRFSTL